MTQQALTSKTIEETVREITEMTIETANNNAKTRRYLLIAMIINAISVIVTLSKIVWQ